MYLHNNVRRLFHFASLRFERRLTLALGCCCTGQRATWLRAKLSRLT